LHSSNSFLESTTITAHIFRSMASVLQCSLPTVFRHFSIRRFLDHFTPLGRLQLIPSSFDRSIIGRFTAFARTTGRSICLFRFIWEAGSIDTPIGIEGSRLQRIELRSLVISCRNDGRRGSRVMRQTSGVDKSPGFDEGRIGIPHFTEVIDRTVKSPTLFSLAQPVDPLVERGWSVWVDAQPEERAELQRPHRRKPLGKGFQWEYC
jgi:hypothetical protein